MRDRTDGTGGVCPIPSAHPALAQLVERVDSALGRESGASLVAEALIDFGQTREAWEEGVSFRSGGYTRHLLHRSASFEVLVLCWDRGLESDLHDHSGQRCWMTALDGEIEELRFRQNPEHGVDRDGVRLLDPRRPAFIRDELGLHVVRARPTMQAISLHLYARPVERCGIYCDRTGRSLGQRDLSYDSARPGAYRGEA